MEVELLSGNNVSRKLGSQVERSFNLFLDGSRWLTAKYKYFPLAVTLL